jgi:hypothetical protein
VEAGAAHPLEALVEEEELMLAQEALVLLAKAILEV